MAVNTAGKQRGRPFAGGQSGNPAGRPKGSRSKLGEQFLADVFDDWTAHGAAVIAQVRSEKPDVYLKVIASILPRELNIGRSDFDSMSDDELIARIRALDGEIRPLLADEDLPADRRLN